MLHTSTHLLRRFNYSSQIHIPQQKRNRWPFAFMILLTAHGMVLIIAGSAAEAAKTIMHTLELCSSKNLDACYAKARSRFANHGLLITTKRRLGTRGDFQPRFGRKLKSSPSQ